MSPAACGRRLPATLFIALVLTPPLLGAGARPHRAGKEGPPAGAFEARFSDDSVLKLRLCDVRIEVTTPYGKLLIPVADIQQVEFATRIPEDDLRRVEAGVDGA